jgi:hypothetical protein
MSIKKSPKSKSKRSPLRGKYPSKSTTFTLKKKYFYWEYTSKFFIPKSEKDRRDRGRSIQNFNLSKIFNQ